MKFVEIIYPVGGFLTPDTDVSAIVECTPDEAPLLPGVEWHGFAGGHYHAHLRTTDAETARAIFELADRVGFVRGR